MRMTFGKIFVASAVLAVAAVGAQAEATVKVPFSFSVGGKQCPAGSYVVSKDQDHGQVVLRGVNGKRSFVWLTDPADDAANPHKVTLKFDVTAADHSLRTVQYGKNVTARLDAKTQRSEHEQLETISNE